MQLLFVIGYNADTHTAIPNIIHLLLLTERGLKSKSLMHKEKQQKAWEEQQGISYLFP